MEGFGEKMATDKQFLFPAAVVYVAVTCLVLLFWSSFRQSSVATPCSQLSGNNTGGEAVTDVMRLLHGNVERVLIDGQLPVDPRENTSWSLWSSDPPGSPCHEYKTRFGKRLPPVWLSSFPCSGNTWTRYLLEGASGVFTGSIYDDKTLRKKGYLGEHDSVTGMRTLVQKIHTIPPCKRKALKCPANNRTIPAVLLLRNPAKVPLLCEQKHKGVEGDSPGPPPADRGAAARDALRTPGAGPHHGAHRPPRLPRGAAGRGQDGVHRLTLGRQLQKERQRAPRPLHSGGEGGDDGGGGSRQQDPPNDGILTPPDLPLSADF